MPSKPIAITDLESVYRERIAEKYNNDSLNAQTMVNLSLALFRQTKIKSVKFEEDDKLFFQYGIYDWGDSNDEHFCLELIRQVPGKKFEIFHLSVKLIYDPLPFRKLLAYSSWNNESTNITEWELLIKSTEGYLGAKEYPFRKHELNFVKI